MSLICFFYRVPTISVYIVTFIYVFLSSHVVSVETNFSLKVAVRCFKHLRGSSIRLTCLVKKKSRPYGILDLDSLLPMLSSKQNIWCWELEFHLIIFLTSVL